VSETLVKKNKHKSVGIQFDCPAQACKVLSTSQEEPNATAVIKAVCSGVNQSPAGFRVEAAGMVVGRGLRP